MARVPYQAAVGALLYLSVCTRPDIAFAVSSVARFMSNPGSTHWEAVKRILRYLKGTLHHGLVFRFSASGFLFSASSDATWGSVDVDRFRSTTGYVISCNGTPVSWRSSFQRCTALSSTEAEYIAASDACREVVWFRSLLFELRISYPSPSVIYVDNRGCIDLSSNPIHHERNKHIHIRYHFLRRAVDLFYVTLVYQPSSELLADLFTKPLRAPRFEVLGPTLVSI